MSTLFAKLPEKSFIESTLSPFARDQAKSAFLGETYEKGLAAAFSKSAILLHPITDDGFWIGSGVPLISLYPSVWDSTGAIPPCGVLS